MKITFFGNSHGAPEIGRFCSGTYFETEELAYLVDCGAPVDALMINAGKDWDALRAIFITHMHVDHIGNLCAMLKQFGHYHPNTHCTIHFPEEEGLDAFLQWYGAMHHGYDRERIFFKISREGVVYDDGTLRVSGITTDHIHGFPTFAFRMEFLKENKKVLYTGDMSRELSDFPKAAFDEDWDCIISEMTHYDMSEKAEMLARCRTKMMIFNHRYPSNEGRFSAVRKLFPFPTVLPEDGDVIEV